MQLHLTWFCNTVARQCPQALSLIIHPPTVVCIWLPPLTEHSQLHLSRPPVLCPAGPLVVGLTLSAVAVGAAFSAGAIAFTTLILPMLLLMSVGGLASFGLFAGLGAMFVLPKLVFSAVSLVSVTAP